MASAHEIVKPLVQSALSAAAESGVSRDSLARALLHQAVAIFRSERSVEDIRNELEFVAENLEPEDEYFPFMRP